MRSCRMKIAMAAVALMSRQRVWARPFRVAPPGREVRPRFSWDITADAARESLMERAGQLVGLLFEDPLRLRTSLPTVWTLKQSCGVICYVFGDGHRKHAPKSMFRSHLWASRDGDKALTGLN
jgi:hypothetical protein